MPHDALQTYLDLMTPDLAADSQAQIDRYQQQHGLFFGPRPMCIVLRPRLMTHAQYQFLCSRVRVLLQAFAKAEAAALKDASFRQQFGLTPEEEELALLDPGYRCSYPTSRLDAFYVSDTELKFTEYNSETPAGAGYNHALSAMFLGLPIMREYLRKYHVHPVPTHTGVLHALLDSYQQWSGRRERPRIGILDWKEVPTYSEFVIFRDYFRAQGLECVIGDPREVEYKGGKLYAEGQQIDLIYKRVLISELLQKGGINHPIIQAVRNGHVCMVNHFRCKILFKKSSFAVLTDERNAHLFSTPEQEVIATHVPWTRVVEERKTVYKGQTVDLIPHVIKYRENFVLKPNDEYGGKGIVLGWTKDAATWENAIKDALQSPHIVQQRVRLPAEMFPVWQDNQLRVVQAMLDTAPYCCYGQYMEGSLCRIATDELLNVTAGTGSTVPTFLVEPRR